jgi:hypothetical protein
MQRRTIFLAEWLWAVLHGDLTACWALNFLQILELPWHPYFVGVQFHPEFRSRPGKPSPLFTGKRWTNLRFCFCWCSSAVCSRCECVVDRVVLVVVGLSSLASFRSEFFFGKNFCSTFVVIWQNLSNHGLARFKRFVSTFIDKLCN